MEFTYIYLEKSRSLGAPAGGERIKGVQLLLRRESGRRAGAIEGDSLFFHDELFSQTFLFARGEKLEEGGQRN